MPDRFDGRAVDELRPLSFEVNYIPSATGSVLIAAGSTRVICTATIEDSVPGWMRGRGTGWLTAEYGMLPGSTNTRKSRDASRGKLDGRTVEIQRLIGRSLRAVVDMKALGERTIWIDCDVIQADGGTRCLSITGGYVALHRALASVVAAGGLRALPLRSSVAAVSVGVVGDVAVLDLPYAEDSTAEVDMNVVMTGAGDLVEVQGTAEGAPFPRRRLDELLDLATAGLRTLAEHQGRAASA